MGPDVYFVPLIGVAGVVAGVIATIMVSHIQGVHRTVRAYRHHHSDGIVGFGEGIDLRELRVLRALFGEPKGRLLESFKDKYYRPFLEATIAKGWVKQVGKRYYMTSKGGEFCRTYLNQILNDWKPAD